jgi:glucose 1-dehydrogenase
LIVIRYKNKRAIITGGAQGIGLACAQRLLNEGAQVLAADIQKWEGSAASSVLSESERFRYRRADVTSRQEVEAMVAEAVASATTTA